MTEPNANAAPPPGPPNDTPSETHHEPRRVEASHAPADEHDGPVHGAVDHGGEHGHDDHAHAGEVLGPVDTWAWGAGLLGIAVAAVTVVCFALATGAI